MRVDLSSGNRERRLRAVHRRIHPRGLDGLHGLQTASARIRRRCPRCPFEHGRDRPGQGVRPGDEAAVTIADRARRRLKVVDSDGPLAARSAVAAVIDTDPVSEADRTDDDLVLLRGVELRPFLASMVGFSDLIASGDLNDDQRLLYIGALLREGRRLTGLLNNALALQRLEMGHRELDLAPVDLRALIQRAVLAAGKDEQRPIDVHLPEQLPLVTADAEAILEVLASFLSNARRFSPDGGAIRIRARQAGDMVEVYIRDHGVGIEAEALPSSSASSIAPTAWSAGWALARASGLAINHKIINAHGGHVEAVSKGLGKGAGFRFTLPISRPEALSGDVLIVEDDPGFASLMRAEFAAEG